MCIRDRYENAAEQGHANAQNSLGIMYQLGQGVDVNYKKAIEWYEKAAKQGDAHAQFNVGVMYKKGRGVDVNYKKAMEWFEKAAQQGHAEAQDVLPPSLIVIVRSLIKPVCSLIKLVLLVLCAASIIFIIFATMKIYVHLIDNNLQCVQLFEDHVLLHNAQEKTRVAQAASAVKAK